MSMHEELSKIVKHNLRSVTDSNASQILFLGYKNRYVFI